MKKIFLALSALALLGAGCGESIPAPAPSPTLVPPGDCSGPGDQCPSGYTCIERCGPPVAREDDPPPGYYCAPDSIAAEPRNCPICLASNAMIGTPWGEVAVSTLEVGDVVWTAAADGKKTAIPLVAVARKPVSVGNEVVYLKLSDDRAVWVSANHPTADGRFVGALQAGDAYDGASVLSAERVPYADDATYDLLPEGDTGYYWANGILLGSTLITH